MRLKVMIAFDLKSVNYIVSKVCLQLPFIKNDITYMIQNQTYFKSRNVVLVYKLFVGA